MEALIANVPGRFLANGLFTLGLGLLLVFVSPSAHAAVAVAEWNFDGGLGDSGAGAPLHMTAAGSVGYSGDTPTGDGGTSLRIGSAQSYGWVTPGSNAKLELSAFTIECWVKLPTAVNPLGYVFAYNPKGAGNDGRGFLLGIWGQQVGIAIGIASGTFPVAYGSTPIADGAWHHIAATYDVATQRADVFVDGALSGWNTVGSIVYSDKAGFGPDPKTAYVGIAHNSHPTGPTHAVDLQYPLPDGTLIDGLRIHGEALSEGEVARLAGVQATPVACWSFDGSYSDSCGDFDLSDQGSNVRLEPTIGRDKAASFDGGTTNYPTDDLDRLEATGGPSISSFNGTGFSVMGWIRHEQMDDAGSSNLIISQDRSGSPGPAFGYGLGLESSGELSFLIRDPADSRLIQVSDVVIPEAVWTHFAVTWGGGLTGGIQMSTLR